MAKQKDNSQELAAFAEMTKAVREMADTLRKFGIGPLIDFGKALAKPVGEIGVQLGKIGAAAGLTSDRLARFGADLSDKLGAVGRGLGAFGATIGGTGTVLLSLGGAAASAVAALSGMRGAAQTSGLNVFTQAMEVLGATVGTVLAPVFVSLAAAAAATAEWLWGKLKPALGDFTGQVFKLGMEVVPTVIDWFNRLWEAAKRLAEWLDQKVPTKQEAGTSAAGALGGAGLGFLAGGPIGAVVGGIAGWFAANPIADMIDKTEGIRSEEMVKGLGKQQLEDSKKRILPDEGGEFRRMFIKQLGIGIQAYETQGLPKPQITSFMEARNRLQEAALQPPWEAKKQELLAQMVQIMREQYAKLVAIEVARQGPVLGF